MDYALPKSVGSDNAPSSEASRRMVIVPEAEIESMRRFMSQLEGSMMMNHPFRSSFAFTQLGTHATALHVSSTTSPSWIIDSGASDHMTSLFPLFSSYSIYSGRDKVKVADETLSSISGKGGVNVSPTMTLSSILHVPKFATNLLSINRIVRDLNCSVTFFSTHYVFQDLTSKQMIGSRRVADGLYFLDAQLVDSPSSTACHSRSSCIMHNKARLMQWNNQLGRLSLSSLRVLFPSLFLSGTESEVCHLFKYV